MNATYVELARLVDEDRSRMYSTRSGAQQKAARLRAAADRCCRTVGVRLRAIARAWFPGREPARTCC